MNRIVTANSPLWKKLLSLTKPGIIGGNLLPMLAGFFMATGGKLDFTLFPALIGTICVIASGCVFNNFIDIICKLSNNNIWFDINFIFSICI
jgi:heme O synthase-like polyprenyltransferase